MQSALIIICFYYIGTTFGQNLDILVYRLPNSITPLHYTINLSPQLIAPFSLEGEVLIKFQTLQDPIDEIVLHLGDELQLAESNVSLVDGMNNRIKVVAIDNDEANQMVSIKTNASLSPVSLYTITLPFKGSLRTDGKGLYVGSFKDTPDKYYLSSNFYPIHARLAFPCFDEPNFKATFDMTVIRPESYSAVFNSPVNKTRQIGNGMISETFSTTPKMAVHSLSLFIGNVSTTSFVIESINLTIIHHGFLPFSLTNDITLQNIISVTDNLLSFSLNSIKIILLPNINSATMGGFRVMYFNDDFFDFQSLTISELLDRYEIFLDRLLKQYFTFGVTPRWWSDIWLSEGVSTYLQHVIMDRIVRSPTNFYPCKMLISTRHKVLKHDISNRPLADDSIQSPQQILSVVSDDLKKYKGALILTMLELSLPAGTLMVTLNNYLSQKLYGTATTAEFINILNTTLKTTGGMVDLGSWFYESGYPLVSVKKKTNTSTVLTQEKFCEFGTQCQNSSSWEIPITFMTKYKANYKWIETKPEIWLGLEPLNVKNYIDNNSWIILNNQAQGYYRINYNKDALTLIKEMLSDASNFNNENIDNKMSRGQIVDDVMALAAEGLVNYSIALDIVGCYKHETNYFVLTTLFSSLDIIETVLYREAENKNFQVYLAALVEGISESFTISHSAYTYSLTKALLIPWSCVANITTTCNSYTQIAEEFINGQYDWLETVSNIEFHEYICAGVRYNNGKIFQNLTIGYQTSMNTPYHQYFVTGIGCITNKNNLNSVLQNITQQTSFIAKEDIKFILGRMTSLIENTDEIMDFIATEAKFLEDLYGEELLANTILHIEEKLTKEVHINQLFRISTTANLSSTVIEMANLTLLHLKTRISLISSFKTDIMKYFGSNEKLTTLQLITVSTTNLPNTKFPDTQSTANLPFTSSPTTTSSSVTSSVTCNSTICPSSSARNNRFSLSIFYITFGFVFLNVVLFQQM